MTDCSISNDLSTSDKSRPQLARSIVDLAKDQIGDNYHYSGKGPDAFDCSGLVSYVYTAHSIHISGSSASIYRLGPAISIEQAQPGDLVLFKKKGQIFHVSIISKVEGPSVWVIHSTSSRGVIEEDIMSSKYWKPKIDKIISLNSLIR